MPPVVTPSQFAPQPVWMHRTPSRNPSEGCVVTCHCADCIGLPTTPSPHSSGGPPQYLNCMSGHFAGLWAGLFAGCGSKGGLAGLLGELPPLTPRDGLGLRLSSALSPSSPSQSLSVNVVCSEVEQSSLPGNPVRTPGIVFPELAP